MHRLKWSPGPLPVGGVRGRTFAFVGVAWVVVAAGTGAPWPVVLVGALATVAPLAGAGAHAARHARQAVHRIRAGGSRAGSDPDGPDPLALAMGYATGGCGPGSGGRRRPGRVTAAVTCPSCGGRLDGGLARCPNCHTPV